MAVDAIVNAANSRLAGGGGVDGAIHRAGGPVIAEQCREWIAEHGRLPTGDAMVTDGGNLPARFVIHTVGPIWGDHDSEESRALLASCYTTSLDAASDRDRLDEGVVERDVGPALGQVRHHGQRRRLAAKRLRSLRQA